MTLKYCQLSRRINYGNAWRAAHPTALLMVLLLTVPLVYSGCTDEQKVIDTSTPSTEPEDPAPDSGDTDTDTDIDTDTPLDIEIHSIGPSNIGFFSSIAFHPLRDGEVWASGDDSSGLYKSNDGGDTWAIVAGLPLDQATYSLCFDENLPDRIYAPNHFGRGFLYSGDSGVSWQLSQEGLPDTPGEPRRIEAAVVVPDSGDIYVATPSGLYVSTTGGSSFAVVSHPALATAEGFKALAADSDHLVAGSENGRVYSSPDGGTSWTELTSGDGGIAVSDLALTSRSIYTGFLPWRYRPLRL